MCASPIRVEWGAVDTGQHNIGAVRGPDGRAIWVRYHPREPREPRVPRPLSHDEWPTSSAFAEMVESLSPGIRRSWRIRIIGANISSRRGVGPPTVLARRYLLHGGCTMYEARADMRSSRSPHPLEYNYRPSDVPTTVEFQWESRARLFRGRARSSVLTIHHRRNDRRYMRQQLSTGEWSENRYFGCYPVRVRTQRVAGPHVTTPAMATRLRAAAAAALGRRGEPAAFFAAVD